MFKIQRITIIIVGAVAFLAFLMLSACDTKPKGAGKDNVPPTINFANIPPDSFAFSFNPEVNWHAIDVDGYVTNYQYVVIIADSVESLWGGVSNVCSFLEGIAFDNWVGFLRNLDTTVTFISAVDTTTGITRVQLFAGETPADSIDQYLFVRAVDNENAISNVRHRMFSRNNHRPKSHINYAPFYNIVGGDTILQVRYCLPETTETWEAIKLNWIGSDSLDYEGAQPMFLYKWELWGPFADTFGFDSITYSSLIADSTHRLVSSSLNEFDSTVFVNDQSLPVTGLVNYPNTIAGGYQYPDSGNGWYLYLVWTLDDAFALSDIFSDLTGHLWFKTIHPQFTYQSDPQHSLNPTRKALILDCSKYDTLYYGNAGYEIDSLNTQAFYEEAFDFLVNEEHLLDVANFQYNHDYMFSPETLSSYNMVVVISSIGSWASNFADYLNMGGNMWVIGPEPDLFFSGGWSSVIGLYYFQDQGYYFPITYFGLLAIYNSAWMGFKAYRNEEFIAADRFPSFLEVPEYLKVDSVKVANQVFWGSTDTSMNYPPNPPNLPYSSYAHLGNAERIYTFISSYPDTSSTHDKPCGSVYEGPTFKTAYIGFGLHFIEEGENGETRNELFKEIVEWFWEE